MRPEIRLIDYDFVECVLRDNIRRGVQPDPSLPPFKPEVTFKWHFADSEFMYKKEQT